MHSQHFHCYLYNIASYGLCDYIYNKNYSYLVKHKQKQTSYVQHLRQGPKENSPLNILIIKHPSSSCNFYGTCNNKPGNKPSRYTSKSRHKIKKSSDRLSCSSAFLYPTYCWYSMIQGYHEPYFAFFPNTIALLCFDLVLCCSICQSRVVTITIFY